MTVNSGTVTITATRSGYSNIVKIFTLSKSRQGPQGPQGPPGEGSTVPGPAGPDGPGVVFRGRFNSSTTYFRTTERRDIVTPANADSPYFITNNFNKSGTSN